MAYTKSSIDLEYVLLGVKFDVEFLEDCFTEEEEASIRDFIDAMSREMHIDKSYVECKDNKRKSAFMLEKGWHALSDTVLDTQFCRNLPIQGQEVIVDAFVTMARCYMYECLTMKTDKFASVNILVKEDSSFDVVVCKDVSHEYRTYVGRWQDWNLDDNGHLQS